MGPQARETSTTRSPVAGAGSAQLRHIVQIVEELWPPRLAESWDAVGLVVGEPDRDIHTVMLAVDPTPPVVAEAIHAGADLLITHHPLYLTGTTSVAATTYKGRIIHRLITAGCALLTAHTNADSAQGGVNDALVELLHLREAVPLRQDPAGGLGEGMGRIGSLVRALTLEQLAVNMSEALARVPSGIRVAGPREGQVERVAVCGGSGGSLIDAAAAAGADAYLTCDLRHHQVLENRYRNDAGKPYLIDLSHYGAESLWLPFAAQSLRTQCHKRNLPVEILVSDTSTDPWEFALTPG